MTFLIIEEIVIDCLRLENFWVNTNTLGGSSNMSASSPTSHYMITTIIFPPAFYCGEIIADSNIVCISTIAIPLVYMTSGS